MGYRHKTRELALQYLYQRDLKLESLTQDPREFSRYYQIPENLRSYFFEIVEGVEAEKQWIDSLIESVAENWKLYRMAKVDLAILRMATWELRFRPELDFQIIIDEAIELAKTFGSSDSAAFVNGILDKMSKIIRKSDDSSVEESAAVSST